MNNLQKNWKEQCDNVISSIFQMEGIIILFKKFSYDISNKHFCSLKVRSISIKLLQKN